MANSDSIGSRAAPTFHPFGVSLALGGEPFLPGAWRPHPPLDKHRALW
jgi:hypothetical protein